MLAHVADEAQAMLREEASFRPTILNLFTGKGREARLDRKALLGVVRQGRRQALEVVMQTQVAVLKDLGEMIVRMHCAHLHDRFRAEAMRLKERMEADIEQHAERLNRAIEQAYARLGAEPPEALRSKLLFEIDQRIGDYFDFVDKLRQDFYRSTGLE